MGDEVRIVLKGEVALSPDVRWRLERVAADIRASPTLGVTTDIELLDVALECGAVNGFPSQAERLES